MRVSHLSLSDFRNYVTAEVPFLPGQNLVVGRNGQGKTNLVEAIAYFATLTSHRTHGDTALIRAGAESAIMRMRVGVDDREVLLEAQLNSGKPNRAQVNRNAVRPRELTRWFSCVVFAPEDLMLIRGEPGVRRRFLDEAVIARQPSFAAVIAEYERVVKQRTALLKATRARSSGGAVDDTLDIWDSKLIDLGSRIMFARRALCDALETPLHDAYEAIVEQDHLPTLALSESVHHARDRSVSRETSVPRDEQVEARASVSRETLAIEFAEALRLVRDQERERAVTLIGPHRDDVHFGLHGLQVKGYASHGETWSFALSLRLALASLLRDESVTGDPVVILDDVFAELDARRRHALMKAVAGFEQVIVTAAVADDVPPGDWHEIHVVDGAVVGGGRT